jgi:hypothetical protein
MAEDSSTTVEQDLTEEQLQTLWEQTVQVLAEEQKAYDSTVRTLAAGAVAVTVSLATALKTMPAAGKVPCFCSWEVSA